MTEPGFAIRLTNLAGARIRQGLAPLAAAAMLAGLAPPGEARVVKFEILSVESPAFEGREFGDAGRYEKLVARATLAVDPAQARNAGIVDLGLAPRNPAGEVEFTADVEILKPVDIARTNGRLFYDVLNRGGKLGLVLMNDAPQANNPRTAAQAGNGFLMREGYTIVWSAWQGDVPAGGDRMLLSVPVVPGVTGTSREEFIFENNANPMTVNLTYPAAEPALGTLTVRQREGDTRATSPGLGYRYVSPTQIEITRPAGFDAGAIYEFIYQAKNPKVMGLGFAATRDIVSFLRYEASAPQGGVNPFAPHGRSVMPVALALGISQSGRFLRDLLYQGFNEDEAGRVVFDGLIPHIAGSRKTFVNDRFAQPGRYSRQHEDHLYPGDQFPFTYGVLSDHLTGRTDGILKRCLAAGNCPRIMHTDTSTEIWQGRASLVVTDTAGNDIALPENVRAYLLSGLPHFVPANATAGPTPVCEQLTNPLHAGPAMRAVLRALDEWVVHGTPPPDSRFPSRAEGTWVSLEASRFPAIPNLTTTGAFNSLRVADHAQAPPALGATYPVFVTRVDESGHDVAGIRLPPVEVPVATFLGWNPRRQGFARGQLCSLTGSAIALPETREQREAANDPRPSLVERYPDHETFLRAVHAAAERLFRQRFLLEEDAYRYIDAAREIEVGKPKN
ncbi:MAG: alpha/beta hydrolase domain-containing protein [Pseudomonadota bacterium]